MSDTTSPTETTGTTRGSRRWLRPAVVLLAVVGNAVVWLIGSAAGVDYALEVPGRGDQTVGLGPTISITLVSALVAWGLLALLERRTRRGYQLWLVLAAIVYALFLIPPLTSGATTGTRVALLTLHTVEALILVVGLRAARR